MNISMLLLLGIGAFALCLALTPPFRILVVRRGWLDRPDFVRKVHALPVPHLGGVPVVAAYLGSLGLVFALYGGQPELSAIWSLIPPLLLVTATGVIDDLTGLSAKRKLAAQTVAASLAWAAGFRISTLAGLELYPMIGVPLTIAWLVACMNALNLVDGVDGVAGGIGVVAALTALSAAIWTGHTGLAVLAVPLAGALLGFLVFNHHPASIFLGDSGSLSAGFLLGCVGIVWSREATTWPQAIAPVLAISVPVFDTALAVARRALSGRSIFEPDSAHIHHRLLAGGLTPRGVACAMCVASGVAGGFALLMTVSEPLYAGVAVILYGLLSVLAVRRLAYPEFSMLVSVLQRTDIRARVRYGLALRTWEDRLRRAATPEECWEVARRASREFGFRQSSLKLGNQHFRDLEMANCTTSWNLHVPLSDSEFLILDVPIEQSADGSLLTPFVGLLHRVLPAKAAEFQLDRRTEDAHPAHSPEMPGSAVRVVEFAPVPQQ